MITNRSQVHIPLIRSSNHIKSQDFLKILLLKPKKDSYNPL